MKCFKYKILSLNDIDFAAIQNIADHFAENAANNFLILASVLDILNRSSQREDISISAQNVKMQKKAERIIEYANEKDRKSVV